VINFTYNSANPVQTVDDQLVASYQFYQPEAAASISGWTSPT